MTQSITQTALLAQAQGLTSSGLVVMIGCIGLVLSLAAFCFYRLFRESNPSEHHHAPLDIDTHDQDD